MDVAATPIVQVRPRTAAKVVSRRRIIAISAGAIALGLVAEHVGDGWTGPAYIPILDLGIGWLMVGCGLAAAVTRPGQPAGMRLALAGFSWLAGTFMGASDGSVARLAGFVVVGYYDLILAWLALSFPGRWPTTRLSRAALAVPAILFVAQSIARFALFAPATLGLGLIEPDLNLQLVLWLDTIRAISIAVAGVVLLGRVVRAAANERRYLVPVLVPVAVSSIVALASARYAMTVLGFLPEVAGDDILPLVWIVNTVHIIVPLSILYGVLELRGARSAIAGAVSEVGALPTAFALRDALAAALGDDTLRILSWDQRGAYRDTDGRVITDEVLAELDDDAGLRVVRVDDGRDPLAVIVVARSIAEDPTLLEAGVSLTRLVVRNEHQAERIREQLEDVRASRARIVEAADIERRRIERDLHDGLQQRMVALAMQLRAAEGTADRDEALRSGSAEILAILEDVRELARGIHPAVLTEAGLGAAIRAAADRSPVPAEVEARLGGAGSPAAQATAYFVVSEALANVAKHAATASGVWIRADDDWGRIRVVVEDDGPGGADATGHGLSGLADRVAALDGTFTVGARDGGGTRIVAEVPVA